MKNKYLRKIKFKRYTKYFYIGFLCLGCFILGIYFTYSKFSVFKDTEVVRTTVGDFISGDVVIGAYINGEYSKTLPKKSDGYIAEKVVCDNNAIGEWNYDEWSLTTKNITTRSKCNVYFIDGYSKNFDYTGSVQEFVVPKDGTYKLEVWGAQGGSSILQGVIKDVGGQGGYSNGNIHLSKNTTVYVVVGGASATPKQGQDTAGGYNGGGLGTWDQAANEVKDNTGEVGGGGGGATHIALKSGLLSTLENSKSDILIVAGGGGGANCQYSGGSGGGISGNQGENSGGTGGNQTSGCTFGKGCNGEDVGNSNGVSGGGGGFYGGNINSLSSGNYNAGGGGSGYIGNSLLTKKIRPCQEWCVNSYNFFQFSKIKLVFHNIDVLVF